MTSQATSAAAFANRIGWSDVEPFEVVRSVSSKCLEVRRMEAQLDQTWKPEVIPGGFAGHCTNNRSQKYTYTSTTEQTVKIRLHKDGQWRDADGDRYKLEDAPRKFYDYNF